MPARREISGERHGHYRWSPLKCLAATMSQIGSVLNACFPGYHGAALAMALTACSRTSAEMRDTARQLAEDERASAEYRRASRAGAEA